MTTPAITPDEIIAMTETDHLAGIAAQYQAVNWAEAFARQPAEPDWLFGTFLERGTVTALFGLRARASRCCRWRLPRAWSATAETWSTWTMRTGSLISWTG